MLSYDLLFYYIISFLFFTEVKGMTASEILFMDSFYPFFKLIFKPILIFYIDSKSKKTYFKYIFKYVLPTYACNRLINI